MFRTPVRDSSVGRRPSSTASSSPQYDTLRTPPLWKQWQSTPLRPYTATGSSNVNSECPNGFLGTHPVLEQQESDCSVPQTPIPGSTGILTMFSSSTHAVRQQRFTLTASRLKRNLRKAASFASFGAIESPEKKRAQMVPASSHQFDRSDGFDDPDADADQTFEGKTASALNSDMSSPLKSREARGRRYDELNVFDGSPVRMKQMQRWAFDREQAMTATETFSETNMRRFESASLFQSQNTSSDTTRDGQSPDLSEIAARSSSEHSERIKSTENATVFPRSPTPFPSPSIVDPVSYASTFEGTSSPTRDMGLRQSILSTSTSRSQLSAQWYRSPSERLGLTVRLTRLGSRVPWDWGSSRSSEDLVREENINDHHQNSGMTGKLGELLNEEPPSRTRRRVWWTRHWGRG